MIERYYNNAIEQVWGEIGKSGHNYMLLRYSNDFSVQKLESVNCLKGQDDVFFACHEIEYDEMSSAYEPYLYIIRQLVKKEEGLDFEKFMDDCDVYSLHRPIISSYFATGVCKREEDILLGEVAYEQERMMTALATMIAALTRKHPLLVVINRFQLASRSTILLTEMLMRQGNPNIGILLGVNDVQILPEFLRPDWEKLIEYLEDNNKIYHIGNSNREKSEKNRAHTVSEYNTEEGYRKLNNLVEFLDFEQAYYFLKRFERMVKFDNMKISEQNQYKMLLLYVRVAIMMKDLSKALEVCEEIDKIAQAMGKPRYLYYFFQAATNMYLGKLEEAMQYANAAYECAKEMQNDIGMFHAELLNAQIQMSGWYNIFFCTQDVKISDYLIEKMKQYKYLNHLAYVYIYAYDNKPEIVAKAYRSEKLLIYFSKGVALAKEIGNEQLIENAYLKNIMLASTNGMYEVSQLYTMRTFETLKNKFSVQAGRNYSSTAYNLCAMGENELAAIYFKKALELFYLLRKPEDIAEVQYNMSLNCIMQERYSEAESYLTQCMKAIEKLQLNSLRVCNLSKLYGLLALTTILQGNSFNCERYLFNCKQFLNYILEKEEMENGLTTVHDYAKSDDDLFLYNFAQALLCRYDGSDEEALEYFAEAEEYLKRAEGNLFFCYALFRKSRMEVFKILGKDILYQQEEEILKEYDESHSAMYKIFVEELRKSLPPIEENVAKITMRQLEELIHQESIERAYRSKKRQLEFISSWQKQFEVTNVSAEEIVDTAMKVFLNHFNVDRAVYIRYIDNQPQVLYNDTECELSRDTIKQIERAMRKTPDGFAVSKISSNYTEHQDVTGIFGDDNVCSLVAIPYFDNAKIESILITYVLMKDNWHSSVNRYMLDGDDLDMYRLLFREMRYALNRIEAYEKIYEINTKLYLSAVTDQLTGIFNREGFYRKLTTLLAEMKHGKREASLGLMFVDLDNFKPYNDTYGHDIGDLVLIRMADIFKKLCENEGFVCRYGGDEFLLVFYTADPAVLEEKAKCIYEEIEQTGGFEKEISEKLGTHTTIEKSQRISCSIGITTATGIQSDADMNEMIKRADALLYEIKEAGKGTYKL
ncbi:MAG: GGDEF domain-containing protein [Lachnospiraceae bacterium]|nr:GGDEF domain-containing protein [Lachnospiraceae bacterium]